MYRQYIIGFGISSGKLLGLLKLCLLVHKMKLDLQAGRRMCNPWW